MLPATNSDMHSGHWGPVLTAANGNLWEFILTDVSQSILGADFLCTNLLLVDIKGQRLIDTTTFALVLTISSPMTAPYLDTIATTDNEFLQLLANYPELTMLTFSGEHPKHGAEHHITMHSALYMHMHTTSCLRSEMLSRLSLTPWKPWSNSPWSSPLHMVAKVNGSWRPCRDYCRLNNVTTPDHYPVPHIQDFSAQLVGTCIYSKVDLVWGYHQIPVHHDDITKMAVITLFGLYEFL